MAQLARSQPATVLASLQACSVSLSQCAVDLERASQSLAASTSDGNRLRHVLSSRKAYQLVTEEEVRAAQFALADAVEQPLRELFERAEVSLDRLAQKANAMQAAEDARKPDRDTAALKKRLDRLRRERAELQQIVDAAEADVARKQASLAAG